MSLPRFRRNCGVFCTEAYRRGLTMTSKKSENLVTAVIVGAGDRGHIYGLYAKEFPARLKIVGVAELRSVKRLKEQKIHDIPDENVFTEWKDLVKKDRLADCAFVTTVDQDHKAPTVALAKLGYHILLEKPMATTAEDCKEIVSTCKESGVMLAVCHVLRYTPWVKKMKELIENGSIGEVTHIQHTESVGSWHFAHAYVRGNWRNETESTFSLLAKCCHDVDLIKYWMDKKCTKISSFGHLLHFTKENKPQGAASRCLDCPEKIESKCPYSAKKIYIQRAEKGCREWPLNVVADTPDVENLTEALKTGPYGRCVYDCDNDVLSNQVINFQFEGGQTAALTMIAFTEKTGTRETKVYGTMGEMTYYKETIELYDFLTQRRSSIQLDHDRSLPSGLSGQSGGDFHTIDTFVKAAQAKDPSLILTGPDDTLQSHLLVFEAEKSRKENRIITL